MVGWHHRLDGQQRVILCLASWKTARPFSTVAPLFLVPPALTENSGSSHPHQCLSLLLCFIYGHSVSF